MWNKVTTWMVLAVVASQLLTPINVEARGGGRGGGGGGRGGGGGGGRNAGSYRGGQTMNRTPTMNRTANRSDASQIRQRAQTREAAPQQRMQQARDVVQQRPTATNRAELRNQVDKYVQSRPAQKIDRQALQQRTQAFSNNRTNQLSQNRLTSDRVSQRLQQTRSNYNHWFDQNFFDRYRIGAAYAGTRANWWRPAAWATLAAWGSWAWSTPYYYDDLGYAYPVSESTYDTTATTTQTQPVQGGTTDGEWLPLGVFAIANSGNAAVLSNRFIQLAINRSGEIAGVFYNSGTDTAQDIIGTVDANSQKAYWSLANRANSPIASTGLYNLTEDQTTINVHFPDGSDQVWTLVRLQQG